MGTLVSFQTRIVVSRPLCGERGLVEQGSTVELPLTAAAVGEAGVARVGKDTGVMVGRGVWVGVSVGGRGVAVGTAAWVCATIVNAAATAVF